MSPAGAAESLDLQWAVQILEAYPLPLRHSYLQAMLELNLQCTQG